MKLTPTLFDGIRGSAQLSPPQAESTTPITITQSSSSPAKSETADSTNGQTRQLTLLLEGKPAIKRQYGGSEINVKGQEFAGTVILTRKNLVFVPPLPEHYNESELQRLVLPLRSISGVESGHGKVILEIGGSGQASFGIYNQRELETWVQDIRRAIEPAKEVVAFPHGYTTSKPSNAWYLAPILLGIIGGLIGFFCVKGEDLEMATTLLVVGIVMTGLVYFLLTFLL